MPDIKSIIKLCIVYLCFSTLGRERIQTQNSIVFFFPILNWSHLELSGFRKKKKKEFGCI